MTPAEHLAATKPKRKQHAVKPTRLSVWTCNIRQHRERLGLALRETAAANNLSTTGLFQIEQGHDVMLTTANRLATFFGVDVWELWTPPVEKKRKAATT